MNLRFSKRNHCVENLRLCLAGSVFGDRASRVPGDDVDDGRGDATHKNDSVFDSKTAQPIKRRQLDDHELFRGPR